MRALLPIFALLTAAWTRDRIALVVENRSSSEKAAAELTPALTDVLASKGYDVIPQAEVTAALRTIGTDAAGAVPMEKLRASLHAESALSVTIRFVLVSGDRVAWRNSLGWIADDAPAPAALGFRRGPPKPTALACERLLWSLPRGRKDPSAVAVVAVESAELTKAAVSTRFAAPVRRLRDKPGVARFPLKTIR